MSILVVDDSPPILRLLQAALERNGFTDVHCADSRPQQNSPFLTKYFMRNRLKLTGIILIATLFFQAGVSFANINPFPLYPNIQANVKFWEKVYAQYSSQYGLIHDTHNLAIIYEVIRLNGPAISGNVKKNRQKIRKSKEKYRRILRRLADGHRAVSAKEIEIQTMFGGHPSPKILREAAHHIRFQLCFRDRFRQGIINSGRYLTAIKEIFSQHHLPTDLAYLPHVESSFNYEAYSKFGAAGIWQFIRSTGRRFMTISYTVDERRDPIIATKSAAKYMQENFQKLQDWPLAITAYNHGAGSMLRAQKQFGDYDKIIENYQNKRFGFASRNFYSEFLAARKIAKHYDKYFPGLKMANPIKGKNIIIEGYADVNDLANFFRVDIAQIKELNPALRPTIFSGQKYIPKGYNLRLPLETKTQIANIPANLYKKAQKRSRFYRVERGDTASKIATMQRIRLRDLLDANQLGRHSVIYVGQNLRIPTPRERRLASLSRREIQPKDNTPQRPPNTKTTKPLLATFAPLTAKPDLIAKPERVSIPSPPVVIAKSVPNPQVIKLPKEPLLPLPLPPHPPAKMVKLAMRPSHNYNLGDLIDQLLSGHESSIKANQPAIGPPQQALINVSPEVVIGNFQVENISFYHGTQMGIIQVQESETLGHYADWLNIPTQRIRDLNHLSFRHRIKAPQKIKIPLDKIDKKTFEEHRYEFHKEIEEDFFAAYQTDGIQSYTVKRGDNVWTITHNELELPFWLIKKYNPAVDFENLQPNQKLIVPIVTPLRQH